MRFLRTFKISAKLLSMIVLLTSEKLLSMNCVGCQDRLIKTQRIAVRGVLRRFKDPPPDPVEPLALGIQQVKNIF